MPQDLFGELERLRSDHNWTQRQMARELDVDAGLWSKIVRGQRGLGPQTLGKIMARFPQLTPQVLLFLQSDVADRNPNVAESPRRRGKAA